jgi:hypothetical protein
LVLSLLPLPSASAQSKHSFINLALWYPASTNRNPDDSANFRLSLIYGRLGTVKGLDLNLIAALLHEDMKGLALTGIYSEVRGQIQGIQLTGVANYVHGDAAGLQASILANIDRGRFTGLQYSTLFNYLGGGLSGVQLSAVLNMTGDDASFLQLAAVSNVSGGSFKGLQVGTFFNYTYDEFAGVQIGGGNYAHTMRGVQVGLGNFARTSNGLQIGFLNQVDQQNGVPIGLINIADNGGVDWVTFGSSLALVNTGIRTVLRNFYSMLTVGGYDLKTGKSETGFINWNFGYAIPFSRSLSLDLDLGYSHISTEGRRPWYALQARALLDIRISRMVAVFGGGGVATTFSEYSSKASSETDPLGVIGISLF